MDFVFELGDAVEMALDISGSLPPVMPIVECTQAVYDAMASHDPGTLYAIPEVS